MDFSFLNIYSRNKLFYRVSKARVIIFHNSDELLVWLVLRIIH